MSDSIDKAELITQYSQQPLDSEYIRMIAHDVRNHLNTILIANDILVDEIQNNEGDALKYIDIIRGATADILVVLDAAVAAAVGREDSNIES